jgi:GT2 family glycosyltransferase
VNVVAVTVNWNRADLTRKAVLSVRDSVAAVVVVDNGSSAEECAKLSDLAHLGSDVVFVWMPSNVGYAAGANRGIECALELKADGVLLMNNDVEAEGGAVEKIVARLVANQSLGIVMPAVVDTSGATVLHTACGLDARTGRASWIDYGVLVERIDRSPRETGYVSGEAFLARAELLRACEGFDERYISYFEDADLSVRARRAGWRLEVVPDAVFRHAVGGSGAAARGIFLRARNQTLFLHWALRRGRVRSIILGSRAVGETALRHAVHGRPLLALGAAAGWAAGSLRVLTDRAGE